MAIADTDPKKGDADNTSTAGAKDPLADSTTSHLSHRGYNLYYNVKGFAFSMPDGWDDRSIALFLQCCKEFKDDFKQLELSSSDKSVENNLWEKIAKAGAEKSNKTNCFTVNSCIELALCLKTYVIKYEHQYTDNPEFKKLYDDVVDFLPVFPYRKGSKNKVINNRAKVIKRGNMFNGDSSNIAAPQLPTPSNLSETLLEPMIIKQTIAHKHLFSKPKTSSSYVYNKISLKVHEVLGIKVDVKKFLAKIKRRIVKQVKSEKNPAKKHSLFYESAGDYAQLFNFMPPRTITISSLVGDAPQDHSMPEVSTTDQSENLHGSEEEDRPPSQEFINGILCDLPPPPRSTSRRKRTVRKRYYDMHMANGEDSLKKVRREKRPSSSNSVYDELSTDSAGPSGDSTPPPKKGRKPRTYPGAARRKRKNTPKGRFLEDDQVRVLPDRKARLLKPPYDEGDQMSNDDVYQFNPRLESPADDQVVTSSHEVEAQSNRDANAEEPVVNGTPQVEEPPADSSVQNTPESRTPPPLIRVKPIDSLIQNSVRTSPTPSGTPVSEAHKPRRSSTLSNSEPGKSAHSSTNSASDNSPLPSGSQTKTVSNESGNDYAKQLLDNILGGKIDVQLAKQLYNEYKAKGNGANSCAMSPRVVLERCNELPAENFKNGLLKVNATNPVAAAAQSLHESASLTNERERPSPRQSIGDMSDGALSQRSLGSPDPNPNSLQTVVLSNEDSIANSPRSSITTQNSSRALMVIGSAMHNNDFEVEPTDPGDVNTPKWLNNFMSEYKQYEYHKLRAISKMHKNLADLERQKVTVLDKILRALGSNASKNPMLDS